MEQDLGMLLGSVGFQVSTVAYVECTKQWHVNRHRSPNCVIGYVLDGNGFFRQDETSAEPQAGEMYLLSENRMHSAGVLHQKPYKKYYCHFHAVTNGADFFKLCSVPMKVRPKNPQKVAEIFETMRNAYTREDVYSVMEVKSCLYQLLAQYFLSCTEEVRINYHEEDAYLYNIISYMAKNLNQKLTNQQLAAMAGYSREYFIRSFHKVMGCPPMQYLKDIRMKTAVKYLKESQMTIDEIARETGYEDRNYFTKVFKQETGYSPVEYRKSNL